MTKLKKLLTCIVFLLVLVIVSGCAEVNYQRIINNDGTIIDAVSVKLDEEKIKSKGYEISIVTNDIKTKMNTYINAFINSFYQRDDGLLRIEKINILNNVKTNVTSENGYIIASLKFKNYNVFKYFYGLHLVEDTEKDNSNVVEEFLFNKNMSTGKTIFFTKDAEFITNEFLAYFDNNFSLEDANLSYIFGTPENKIHSDANYQFEEDGINYHQWLVTDINQEINTFTYQIKPVNWYILALSLTIIFMLILFILSLFKSKNKKTKEISNLVGNIDKTSDN